MKTLLTAGLILLATQAHAQSNPAEPSRCEIESNECHPPTLPIDPCYKPSGGYICTARKPSCKPGQVVFEGRCLTPDRRKMHSFVDWLLKIRLNTP